MKYNKHLSQGGVMKKKMKLTYKALSMMHGTLSTWDGADIT